MDKGDRIKAYEALTATFAEIAQFSLNDMQATDVAAILKYRKDAATRDEAQIRLASILYVPNIQRALDQIEAWTPRETPQ